MNAFLSSQLGYRSLVRMFHNRFLNNQTSKLQERKLRLVYQDTASFFDKLVGKENTFTIHERNIQKLAIKS